MDERIMILFESYPNLSFTKEDKFQLRQKVLFLVLCQIQMPPLEENHTSTFEDATCRLHRDNKKCIQWIFITTCSRHTMH